MSTSLRPCSSPYLSSCKDNGRNRGTKRDAKDIFDTCENEIVDEGVDNSLDSDAGFACVASQVSSADAVVNKVCCAEPPEHVEDVRNCDDALLTMGKEIAEMKLRLAGRSIQVSAVVDKFAQLRGELTSLHDMLEELRCTPIGRTNAFWMCYCMLHICSDLVPALAYFSLRKPRDRFP